MTQTRTPVEPYDPFDTDVLDREVPPEVPRDQWGRPLIAPVGIDPQTCVRPPSRKSAKRKEGQNYFEAYTRVSTLAKALDDQTNIEGWRSRNTALGVALTPSLQLAFRAYGDELNNRENRRAVDADVESAMERSGANERRRIGSGVHKLTEKFDKGQPIGEPGEFAGDVRAYVRATHGFTMEFIERFMVNDATKDAGTPDRIVHHPSFAKPRIGDLKTGNDVLLYAQLSIAMQLANYSDSEFYDPETGVRTPWDIDKHEGIVWHIPAGEGHCSWYAVDLDVGREGIAVAHRVRDMRKKKGIFTKIEEAPSDLLVHELIDGASGRSRLLELRELFRADWLEEHDAHAIDRLAELRA